MAVARIRHGVVVTADARENRPKMKFDNNRVFEYAISFPDGALRIFETLNRQFLQAEPGHLSSDLEKTAQA